MEKECQTFVKDLLVSVRGDKTYSDFVLKVGGEDIPVHRNVLSAASPYFEAMLSIDTIESKRGWAEIFDLDPEAVKTCIDFIYSGKAKLSLENPESLIQASDLMQIFQLKEMYFAFLADNVAIETCLLYSSLASKYHAAAIPERLQRYMVNNVEKIFNSERLSKMGEKELCDALLLFPSDIPNCEIRKWRAIVTWVKADEKNRSGKFPNMFKLLLLEEIPLEYLTKDILLSDFVRRSYECKHAIMISLSSKNQRTVVEDVNRPFAASDPIHLSREKPTKIVARNGETPWLHIMDFSTCNWSRYARLPPHLRGLPIVGVMGKVYLRTAGGSLLRYSNEKWEKVCILERRLCNCQWLAFGDCIWFIEPNSIRKYYPVTDTWSKLPEDPGLKSVSTCAISKERILLMGVDELTNRNVVKEFYFSFREWDVITPNPRTILGACFINETCITWDNWNNMMEKYDPSIEEWVTLPTIYQQENLGRIRQVIASNQYFYLVGERKGAVCECASFKISKCFDIPNKFSNFCLI